MRHSFLPKVCSMMEGKRKILLLGAGTQGLAIIGNLHKAGYCIEILVEEKGNYADVSKYIYKRHIHNDSVDSKGFLLQVKKLISEEKIDVLLPMGDIYAEFLSKNKEELGKLSNFTAPEYECFLKGYDKNELMTLCKRKKYPHPQTIDMTLCKDLFEDDLKSFPFPAMLKPNCTTGGRGMIKINSYEELLEKYPSLHSVYGEYHLQRFIPAGGRQIKIQLCVDEKGELINKSALHKVRWYPVKGGASSCSVSIKEEKMTEICSQILKDIKWNGFADFDLIEDPDTKELLIMEINPRLPACIGAAIRAGMDWGQIMVDQALGNDQKTYSYQEGVVLRHLGFDMLWFIKSPLRFRSIPSWFRFFGSNVYYQDFHLFDQKPFWVGTVQNIKKLMNPSFRKSKQGA